MPKHIPKPVEWITASLLILAAAAIYPGFFRTDPYLLGRFPFFSRLILYGFRIGLPLFVVATLFCLAGWRRGRIRASDLLVFGTALTFCGILAFAAGSRMYHRQMTRGRDARLYHPYLQIAPPGIDGNEKDRGGLHIFCLGGSTTEFVDEDGYGWPARAGTAWKKRFGEDAVHVHNLGRQWYTTLHTLINYEVNLRPMKPDILLVMHTINDLLQNADFSYFSRGPFREDYGHFHGPVVRIVRREGFGTFCRQLLGGLWYHRVRTVIRQDTFRGIAPFERNLHTLIDLAEKDGVRVVLLTQPNLYREGMTPPETDALYMLHFEAIGPDKKWDVETAREGMRQYRDAIRRVAARRNVPVIDLDTRFPKDLDHLSDDVHYTRKGFDRMGELVSEALLPLLTERIGEKQN